MEEAKRKFVENNIAVKLHILPESKVRQSSDFAHLVDMIIRLNTSRSIGSIDEAYEEDEISHPCMDGMAY